MIFVTVGTHEQEFERLIKEVDRLKKENIIREEVIIQKGYTEYEPEFCKTYKILGHEELREYLEKARIIITHGGPSSFLDSLEIGKIPIVVPRQKQLKEHVNNHQVDFVKKVLEKNINIIPIYNILDLEEKIINYDNLIKNMKMSDNYSFNNERFVQKFESEIEELLRS